MHSSVHTSATGIKGASLQNSGCIQAFTAKRLYSIFCKLPNINDDSKIVYSGWMRRLSMPYLALAVCLCKRFLKAKGKNEMHLALFKVRQLIQLIHKTNLVATFCSPWSASATVYILAWVRLHHGPNARDNFLCIAAAH